MSGRATQEIKRMTQILVFAESVPPLGSAAGASGNEMRAWDLVTGESCLSSHRSCICFTSTFTGKAGKYLCLFSLACDKFTKGNA